MPPFAPNPRNFVAEPRNFLHSHHYSRVCYATIIRVTVKYYVSRSYVRLLNLDVPVLLKYSCKVCGKWRQLCSSACQGETVAVVNRTRPSKGLRADVTILLFYLVGNLLPVMQG